MKSIGKLLLHLSLGAMLVVGGIWAIIGGGDFGCTALSVIFSGQILKILKIVFGIIELITGVFLIIETFKKNVFGTLDNLFMIIIIIVWVISIVLGDFLSRGGLLSSGFSWAWLYSFASHCIVLGAMLCIKD